MRLHRSIAPPVLLVGVAPLGLDALLRALGVGGPAALALSAAAAAALGLLVARRVSRPMEALAAGALELARGNLGHEVPTAGDQELGELIRTFNLMSRQLWLSNKENRGLLESLELGYLETVRALVNSLEAKDPYTRGHSQRTTEFALAIAAELGLDEAELRWVELGGLLHDIGKIGIDEKILRKPARLEEAEMAIMRGHPEIGSGVMREIEPLQKVLPAVRSHHERWDGRGYPDGLAGEAIPIVARVVAVADTYDAIVSDRPYSVGQTPSKAVEIIAKLEGTQCDPRVCRALFRALRRAGIVSDDELAAAGAHVEDVSLGAAASAATGRAEGRAPRAARHTLELVQTSVADQADESGSHRFGKG